MLVVVVLERFTPPDDAVAVERRAERPPEYPLRAVQVSVGELKD